MPPVLDTPWFSLLDEPWLPVRYTDGSHATLGLLELFNQAQRIGSIAESAPPSLIAIYRMLLAITHRALSLERGEWKDSDRARWYRKGLPPQAVSAYLEHWRERFWLFHPEHPFMQVAALATAEETRERCKSWTQISLAGACGSAPTLFDHAVDAFPESIHPAFAITTLLGFLQFVPGGLVKAVRDSDKAGPLANTAAALPLGRTLNETLCLTLHPSPLPDQQDLPAWEQAPLRVADLRSEPRLATGMNDRSTRRSRAVLFLKEADATVKWLRFAAGAALAEESGAPDRMASYRAGNETMVRLSFTAGRAFWRDLPTLLPDAEGKASLPAPILSSAAYLNRLLDRANEQQTLLVAGVASDQAKLLRWRAASVSPPVAFLDDTSLAGLLRQQIAKSEKLYSELFKLARAMYAAITPDGAGKEAYNRAKSTLEAGPASATFFAEAERGLPDLLRLIADGDDDRAHDHWHACLLAAARKMWDVLVRGLGESPRALCAEAKHYPRFRRLLREYRPSSGDAGMPQNSKEPA